MNMEEGCHGLVQGPISPSALPEDGTKTSVKTLKPSKDFNQAPPKYKSRNLPIHQPAW
jgi:hypothetical protein